MMREGEAFPVASLCEWVREGTAFPHRIVVGRKQWPHAGLTGGAGAAATMFSRVANCMLQGSTPLTYLAVVLTRVGEHPVNRVQKLTPLAWRLARDGAGPA